MKANILVVDDIPVNLSLLTQMLSGQGYKVRVAPSGKLALASILAMPPDLILLDINMPDMDGYEVCTRIKSNEQTCDIPIIFISAVDTAIDKVKAFTLGAIDYITKPFEPVEVIARIENQLRLRHFQAQLQAQNAQLQLLLTTTQEINAAVDITDALGIALDKLCRTIGLGFAEAWVLDPDGTTLECCSVWYGTAIPAADFPQHQDANPSSSCPLPTVVWLSQPTGIETLLSKRAVCYLHCPLLQQQDVATGVGIPILFNGQIVAALVFFHGTQVSLDRRSLDLIQAVATQLGGLIRRKMAETALKQANQELERLATLDGLTHVANRRRFDDYLKQEWRRLAREQHPLSLLLFDVDYFKNFNDHYGHQVGDECLKDIANATSQEVKRPADLVARYGGEEFAVILPNTDTQGAVTVAQAIKGAIHQLNLPHAQSRVSDRITISMGIASVLPALTQPPESLITTADQALYEAKQQGRDRIVVRAHFSNPFN